MSRLYTFFVYFQYVEAFRHIRLGYDWAKGGTLKRVGPILFFVSILVFVIAAKAITSDEFLEDIMAHRRQVIEVAEFLLDRRQSNFSQEPPVSKSLDSVIKNEGLFLNYLDLHDGPKVMAVEALKFYYPEYPFDQPIYELLHRWHGIDFRGLRGSERTQALATVTVLNEIEKKLKQTVFWSFNPEIGEAGQLQFSALEEWIDIGLVKTDPKRRQELGLSPDLSLDIAIADFNKFFSDRIARNEISLQSVVQDEKSQKTMDQIKWDKMAISLSKFIVKSALRVLNEDNGLRQPKRAVAPPSFHVVVEAQGSP